jgi:hypothetical protein
MILNVYFSPLIQLEKYIDHIKADLKSIWQKSELMWRYHNSKDISTFY